MTQDTRKDRRVKIVSLNVRYKSATVDEFIENHAHDVSRGGIYIKTGSPFPPGTLLKFEVRLASDQAVISGVGRVVWKRDTALGTAERPAGMGVKFIKIDDSSKTVIDKLVNTRADAGKTYEAEVEAAAAPHASERPPSVAPARPAAGSKTPPPAAAVAAPAPRAVGKATMVGLGAVQLPAATTVRPTASAPPPRTSTSPDMFPKRAPGSDLDEPKQEATVMKQAAELLEEALREAGGSMEEVGTNPLFSGAPEATQAKTPAPATATSGSLAPKSGADDVTLHKLLSPIPEPLESPAAAGGSGVEAARARAMVAGMAPGAGAAKKAPSDPPRTTRDSPVAKAPRRESRPPSNRPARTSSRPPSQPAPPIKKGGAGRIVIFGALAAAVAGVAVFRDQIFGGAAPAPEPTASASPASAPPPPPPTASATASAAASASAAPSSTTSAASPAPSASTAPTTSSTPPRPAAATPAVTAKPTTPTAPPAATTTPTATPAATKTPAATTTAAAAPAATATTSPTPAATPAATTTPAPAKTAAPAPAAKPKPAAKPADDNPY